MQSVLDAHERRMVADRGYLDISERGLQSLQGIHAVPDRDAVQSINASHNQLTAAGLTAERLPSHVTTVDVSYNQLNEFPSGFISRLPRSCYLCRFIS